MKQEEFNQDNQPKINLEGIELPLFNIPTNEEETSSFRNLINVESLPTNFVNKLEEEELNSEDKTLNPLCVELPEKDEYLRKKKYLGEFFLEEDKAEARANLGITPLLAELKAIIEAKLVDETGNLKFGLEPTNGAENEEAYGQVLSSAIIYNTLQKYYTKNELDSQSDSIFRLINELKNTKINAEKVYTKEEVDNILFNELFINRLENIAREKVNQGLATVAETGDYNDLINTPTKLSLFLNDSKYLIREDVIGSTGFISDIEQLREQAEKGQQAYNKFISKVDIDDLNDIVKTILGKAESAYQLPETGIPKEDLSNNVLDSLNKADTAYLLPPTGISRNDLSEDVQNSLNEADSLILDVSGKLDIIQDLDNIRQGATLGSTAYLLSNTGIPKSDLSQGVLNSLEHADSIYNSFDEKADKVSNATNGNFAGLNSLGNLIDLNCKPSDFQPKGNYKITLEEVQDPSSDGAGISFIDRISQNTNGVITPHKKNVQNASSNQDGLMSSDHYSKLEGIENGSLVNIIEHISINGNEITPNNKSINLGQHYVLDENYIHTDNNFTSNLKNKLNNVESNAQVNILEGVKVNGTELNIDSNKKVDITITTQNSNNNNSNGTIVVNNSEVSVKGLNNAAYENVASSISDNDSGLVRANMVKNHIDPKFKSITDLIPNEATTLNLLADKEFVNSSIATATADFKGTYNLKSDLELNISATQSNINTKIKSKVNNANNNDYVFILIPTDNNTPTEISHVDRYKYDGTNWIYEFTLNNSSFTATLWAAINSGITTNLVTKLTNLPDNTDLNNSLNNKVSNVSYDTTNKKLTKTINGTTSDIVSASTIVTDGGGIKSHLTVTDNNPSLTWGTKSKVATIGDMAINVTMPSNPNTTYTITTGDSDGQIKVIPSSGSAYNVDVKGLGARAYDSTNYLPLTGGTISGQINLPSSSAISNGNGNSGHYLLNWTGTDTIVSSYQGPTYLRSSDENDLYHRVGKSTDYLILDTNNYSTYALPRSGGSVTSSININYSNADFTKVDNDVSSTLYPGFFIRDKNGKLTGRLFTSVQSNGKLITYIYSNNYDTNGDSVGSMYLGLEISKDGTKKWLISDVIAFRTALGLGSNATSSTDYLPLSGGTLTGILKVGGNTVWHAGNDGSDSGLDADLLDGAHGSEFYSLSRNNTIAINTDDDLNDYNTVGNFNTSGGSIGSTVAASLLNKPTFSGGFRMYVSLLSQTSNTYIRQRIISYDGRTFDRFSGNGSWDGKVWRELAYTDSNVASATKLQTARSIWGNNFDGTADINNHIKFDNSIGVYGYNNPDSGNAELLSILYLYSNNNLRLGYGTSGKGYSTYIYGGDVRLLYGTSRSTGLFLSSTGDVGIGTTSPSYKLHISGTFGTSSNASIGGTLGVTGAATLSSTLAVTGATTLTGLLTANGGIVVPSSKTIKIGNAYLSYDSTNNAIRVSANADGTGAANFYAMGAVSALGQGSDSGGGGGQGDVTWALLAGTATNGRTINISYLANVLSTLTGYTTSGTNYKVQKDSSNHLYVSVPWTNTTYTFATGDSNGQIKVTPSGGTAQNVSVKGLGSLAYKSSLTASDIPSLSYLPLSGGTVTGFIYLRSALTTSNTVNTGAAIGIMPKLGNPAEGDTTSTKAGIGFMYYRPDVNSNDTLTGISISAGGSTNWYAKDGGLFITSSAITWQNNKVWHAGNDGSDSGLDADKLDGLHADSFYHLSGGIELNPSSTNLVDIDSLNTIGDYYCSASNKVQYVSTLPASITKAFRLRIGNFFAGGNRYIYQRVQQHSSTEVYERYSSTDALSYSSWYLVQGNWTRIDTLEGYFTNGSANTAVALKTARSLWGNNFNGTADITGNLTLNNNTYIYSKDSDGTSKLAFGLNAQNTLLLGYETAAAGYNTKIYGNNVSLRYGTSRMTGLFLKSSGEVGIGTTDPSTKLHVSGATTTDTLAISSTSGVAHLSFARGSYNYIHAATAGGTIGFITNGKAAGSSNNIDLLISNGAVSVKGTLSTTEDISVVKTSGASKILSLNGNGKIELLTDVNRGIYDRTAGHWLITTNGTNSWIPAGNLAIGTSANTTYKLYVEGTNGNGKCAAENFYTTSDRSKKENIKQYSEHISKFTLKGTKKDAYGVIALDVPEMFREGEEGNYTVNYNSILSYYVGLLENKNKLLELRISSLESKVKQLKEGINNG